MNDFDPVEMEVLEDNDSNCEGGSCTINTK